MANNRQSSGKMVFYSITVYIFSFLLLFPLGFFIARHGITDPLCRQYTIWLFAVCPSVYGLHMLLNYCILIEDPLLDYWSDHWFFMNGRSIWEN